MCEATVYIDRDGQQEKIMEDVIWVESQGGRTYLADLLGERQMVQAQIKDINLLKHVLTLEEARTPSGYAADLQRAIDFHGHLCIGLIIGYRASLIALRELGTARAADEELVAVVHSDACAVDAIQVITGCTLGKGNLLFEDYGKHVFIFGRRPDDQALRVALKFGAIRKDAEYSELSQKVDDGVASPQEVADHERLERRRVEAVLSAPEEELFATRWVDMPLPRGAAVFPTVRCDHCGEGVMEPRVRLKEGQRLCPECYGEEYSRGW